MNKNLALLALTGVLTLASCGGKTMPNPGTDTSVTTSTLTIDLEGVGSAPITIKDASGAVVAGYNGTLTTDNSTITLPRGKYTVLGGIVSGYNTPAAVSVDMTSGNATAKVTYTAAAAETAVLTIDLEGVGSAPITIKDANGAVVAGYNGTLTADNSMITLPRGKYTVLGGIVSGYNTPAAVSVDMTSGNATAKVTYTAETAVLTINLEGVDSAPITIKDANGAVVSGYENKTISNGATVSLPAGTYTITGGTVSGYNTPNVQTFVVGSSATSVTLTYNRAIATDVTLSPDAGEGNRILTLEQNINGSVEIITYVRGNVTVVPNANSGADRIEVFLSSTTADLNAQNRIYDSRDPNSGSLTINSANLRQGEKQYVIVRYWTGTSNTTKSTTIVPDNLGPQVPDVIPVSKLSPELTQQRGNWVNGSIKLAFQNLDTLRDNPTGTTVLPAGVERVEWYADPTAKDGVASFDGATLLGTSYNSPYEVNVDTTKLADGDYDVFAVAYDQLGNRSVVRAQNLFVLNVDNTGPVVSGTSGISVVDAGTGAVRDEFGRGGTSATYTPRPNAAFATPVNECKIDAIGNDAGNIDLYDSVAVNGREYISGLARVVSLTLSKGISDAGVGLGTPEGTGNAFATIDGQPLADRLYTLGADGRLVNRGALRDVATPECVYLDVNGLDAGQVTVRFNNANATTDLLGNPATGGALNDVTIYVDNQRPSNLRFSKKPETVAANGQATLEARADDSISGLYGSAQFFARDTNGAAFGGRAVQLASADQTNFRFFRPTNTNSKLDLIAVVRDYAGNVSSNRSSVEVTNVGPRLETLNDDNFFVRRQQANGQFLNFGNATDENPVRGPVGTVHSLDLINFGRNANQFNPTNVLQGAFYQEVLVSNPLNRIGRGTNDLDNDNLNVPFTQEKAPLFLIAATESAPFTSVKALESGLFAYHASIIDKNGWVSEVARNINYAP